MWTVNDAKEVYKAQPFLVRSNRKDLNGKDSKMLRVQWTAGRLYRWKCLKRLSEPEWDLKNKDGY